MIKKVSETTPTMASVINTQSDSTEDAYSCDYLNNSDSYSTSEIKTNKRWIDNKKIYRKVYQSTSITSGTENTIASLSINNLNEIINISGVMYRSNGTTQTIPRTHTSSLTYCANTYISSNNEIRLEVGSNLTNIDKVYIIIEYTKTTD